MRYNNRGSALFLQASQLRCSLPARWPSSLRIALTLPSSIKDNQDSSPSNNARKWTILHSNSPVFCQRCLNFIVATPNHEGWVMVQTPHLRMTNAFRFMTSSRSCLILMAGEKKRERKSFQSLCGRHREGTGRGLWV